MSTAPETATLHYDVVIVGAGPAGIFAALELVRLGCTDVLVLEKGKGIERRSCPARQHGCIHCATCAIKACARGKGYEFCIECAQISTCELMINFINDPEYPNGLAVMNNMKRIQVVGVDNWLVEQDKRWRCTACDTSYFWYDQVCPQCRQAVSDYKADI